MAAGGIEATRLLVCEAPFLEMLSPEERQHLGEMKQTNLCTFFGVPAVTLERVGKGIRNEFTLDDPRLHAIWQETKDAKLKSFLGYICECVQDPKIVWVYALTIEADDAARQRLKIYSRQTLVPSYTNYTFLFYSCDKQNILVSMKEPSLRTCVEEHEGKKKE